LTLGISTVVAVAVGWAALHFRDAWSPGRSIALVDRSAEVDRVLLQRQLAPRGLGPFELRPIATNLPREPLDESTVRQVTALGDYMQWDPVQYLRYKPHLDERIALHQHAGGEYHRRTNRDGYREDHETPAAHAGLLVLATGDSHTDGIGDNSESWPNRLELALAASHADTRVEVLNAGLQNTSFYNYLATIERALPLAPDVVVTVCYGGNDFAEVLLLHHMFQHTVRPTRTREYWEALKRAEGIHEPELTQILQEALYFDRFPDQVDRALEASAAVCGEIQRTCASRDIPWILAYLPSAYCLPWSDLVEKRAHDLKELGLTGAALKSVDALADRLLAIVRERGVTVIDLREPLGIMARRGDKRPYWDEFHIDVRGQDLVAQWLKEPVEAALAQRRRAVDAAGR
jgi:lysophospholipase L1-like esterase